MYMYTIRVEQFALKPEGVRIYGQKFQFKLLIFEIKGTLVLCIIKESIKIILK